MANKLKVATCSLAGCFGCHMSFLDIDERLIDLLEVVEFDRSPINDIKRIEGMVDLGLIEGGLCNSENVHVLHEFRKHCRILVSVGECAITGGIPSMRNHFTLRDCLEEAYIRGVGVVNAHIPNDVEIPLLLDKVHPLHEVVKVDYYLPGCPPSADAFWHFLTELVAGRDPNLPTSLLHYD
jgi:NAD-reducing hydrogenase small subunit